MLRIDPDDALIMRDYVHNTLGLIVHPPPVQEQGNAPPVQEAA